ncbi:hypothetical protein B0675_39940 [Streptomyces sp. M41(2017)]|uniref:DUF6197 family protein n=1 Tax=Streptomyces sp. M41(2017) TaxID=1955065 RepID=UPI0009BD8E81|nr:hypothetical protein [Streptomyces sp. M41(2017)]OQQ12991.1 hypothetical protein B0675_39940 [Streptomyces sp. M41(2017)]
MTAPATTARAAAPVELDLDARLVEVGLVMDARLTLANLTFEVDTAHIPAADPIPEITAPLPLTPTAAPCPYPTPIAATLHRARLRLDAAGWCTGGLRNEQGARCLIGAIQAAADSRGQADDACVVLLEAIRRDFPHANTIPSWNDNQRDPRLPARYLERAAELAHSRGL